MKNHGALGLDLGVGSARGMVRFQNNNIFDDEKFLKDVEAS